MNKVLTIIRTATATLGLMAPLLHAGENYKTVMREFASHEQRLAGSPALTSCIGTLEATFRAAGLTPHRQTFDTLVPETRRCMLRVDGREVTPVYALGPNGAANNTAGAREITGPLVWLGDGTLEDMKGKPVEGSIAVLNFNSPNMRQVFSQGALAVVFVGSGTETRQEVGRQFIELDVALPRLFVDAEVARTYGLSSWQPGRKASLSLTTVWKDVEGVNLWVEIPGIKGASFNFEEEAVVLSATMDTFGTVPGRCPAIREAANCALLAEVAVELAKHPMPRSVFVVFFGSHYAMQDGARMFYHAVRTGAHGELESRNGEYQKIIDGLASRIELLKRDDFFSDSHPLLFDVTKDLDKRLAAKVSSMNFELSGLRRPLAAMNRKKNLGPEESATRATLTTKLDSLTTERTSLNELRRQLHKKAITDRETFGRVAAEERAWLTRDMGDHQRLLAQNATHLELYGQLGSKRIVGHYSFDFANTQDDWTLAFNGIGAQVFYHTVNRKFAQIKAGDFVKNLRDVTAMDAATRATNGPAGPDLFTAPVLALQQPDRFCVPSIRSVPSRIAHAMQVFGYQMMTVADPLEADELPYAQAVDLEALSPRMTAFCRGLGTAPELSQYCPLAAPIFNPDSVLHFRGEGGIRYLNYVRGSTDVEGVPRDGVAFCAPMKVQGMPCIAGNSYSSASRILASGHIFMPMMFNNVPYRPLGFDANGELNLFPSGSWGTRRLFYGYGGVMFLPLLPGKYGQPVCTVAEGRSDSLFRNSYMIATIEGVLQFFADEHGAFKVYANGGLLLLGSTTNNPQGTGLPIDEPPMYAKNALRQSAHDYTLLNESRLRILREKAIINESLETLHADAVGHWDAAVEARKTQDIPRAVAHEAFAATMGARVAEPLREVTNDMIRAVVLLLLLTIPFAFVLERLLLNSLTIYRQVLGFAGLFLATFFLLYMAHPAFALAASPMIIFLAFVIILLSVVVMSIVMSKFKRELREIQGLSTSAHGVAADSSTAMAAVLIGISGMRNRPLKTFLTALTIIMLTFTIVVFASFTSMIGVKESYLGKGSGPNRIELRRFSSLAIPQTLLESLKALYGGEWKIHARECLFRAPASDIDGELVVFQKETRKWETLKAMVSLEPEELASNPVLSQAIPGLAAWAASTNQANQPPPLFLHQRVAESLGVTPGAILSIGGETFTFGGTFDAAAVDQLTFLDKARFAPPDFEASSREVGIEGMAKGGTDSSQEISVDATRFTYFPSRTIGITTRGSLGRLASDRLTPLVNAIVMYAGAESDVEATARDVAKVFVGPVNAKGSKGTNQFFFSKSMQASGFVMLIVPLLLGGLIIFNSLLGSIVDRQKEIFTYSALGLAPPDVGALFFAESGVYAILGGMGGYLVSQVAAKVVGLCGDLGWFVPPEMNFSSLASVLTILIVMVMVMISTIYPAIKAGRSANPGVARRWKMPKPSDDRIEFVFPFTVSANDMGGILAFIAEHFGNHGDSSLGNFAASEVELFNLDKRGSRGIRARVSLAPFDLGVMQAFTMFSRPSEIEGIDEVVVELKKVSGTEGAWLRGNRIFVDELRQQFLLWRSLPVATVEHYRTTSDVFASTQE